jgi:hypothetical protein
MTSGPYFATQARRRARWQDNKNDFELSKTTGDHICLCDQAALYPNGLLPRARRRGTSGGDRRRGVGRAHPAGHAPQGRLARRGEIATKTQELRPISNCDALPNHVLRLARFGASPTCATARRCGADRGPITMVLAREVGAPNSTTRRPSMHLVVAAKAHHRSGTSHSRHIGVIKVELHN